MKSVALLMCLAAGTAVGVGAQSATQAQPPQFRATVDLMRVDVTVLDRRTRRPVRDLTADDFEVKVGGQVQTIQAVAQTDHAARATTGPAWNTSAARDVTSSELGEVGRLIVIVFDDSLGGAWHRQAGKKVAHAIVDQLGADDLAAVVFVNRTDRSQDLTKDRTLLRAAIEAFDPLVPGRFQAPDAPGTIRNVREFLAKAPSYRRAIMVITSRGFGVSDARYLSTGASHPDWFWLRDAGTLDSDGQANPDSVEAGSRLGHVPIHFITTFGLRPETSPGLRMGFDDTDTLARAAGGRAIVGNNEPHREVPALLEEMSVLYSIAYRPSFPLDGRLRYAEVTVKRPNVLVLPSSGAFRTARELDDESLKRRVTQSRGSGLLDAAAAPMMGGELTLRAAVAALPVVGAKEHPVALTIALPTVSDDGPAEQFRLVGFVYDGEGRRQLSTFEQVVTVSGGPASRAPREIVLRLDLKPGRYNLRVAVQAGADETGPAGSLHLVVAVPDINREPLAVSSVAVGWAEGRPIGGREALAGVLPFAPTTVRSFARTDHVGALMTMYQGRSVVDATVTAEVVNSADDVVTSSTRRIDATRFNAGTGVEHRYEVPLATMPAGDYLLRFTVVADGVRVLRDVRFTVRP